VGLWINGFAGCTNGGTPQGLLGIDLHKVKPPKQMLWVFAHQLEVFLVKEKPEIIHNVQACPKGLAEGTSLSQRSRVRAGEPIHDSPGGRHEIGDNVSVVGVISPLDVVKGDVVLCVVLYRWVNRCCGSTILGFMWCVCGMVLC
jgi:hypothetical protein